MNSEIRKAKRDSKKRSVIEVFENTYTVTRIQLLFYKPCIYFLKKNNHTVYIGETTSLMTRISQHVAEGVKDFDSFSFNHFKGSDMERKAEEARLINRIKPIYNKTHI